MYVHGQNTILLGGSMLTKLKALFELFKAGKRVGNPATWKKRQIGVDAVHGLLWAGATVYCVVTGTELPVTGEALDGISAAVVTAVPAVIELYNILSTIVTTNKVGLPAKSDSNNVNP